MIIEPQRFAPDHKGKCIHCDKPYDVRLGAILWHGDQNAPGFKDTFICGPCSKFVIPGLVRDFMSMDFWPCMHERHAKYMIEAGEAVKNLLPYTK